MPTADYIKKQQQQENGIGGNELEAIYNCGCVCVFFLVAAKTSAPSIRCQSWPTTMQPSSQSFAVK